MILNIDPASPNPPYEQLRAQVTAMIGSGVLPAGQRLPAIRQLAADLGLAPGTVARAYVELERQGHIRTRRGQHGSVVADAPTPMADTDRGRHVGEAARQFAVRARQLGLERGEALRHIEEALAEVLP